MHKETLFLLSVASTCYLTTAHAAGDCVKFETNDARFTDSLAAHYLDLHNEKRAQYCLPPLVWDQNLAKVAQAWADGGNADGPHNSSRNAEYAALIGCTSNCPDIGENMSWQAPWDFWPVETMIDGWLAEESWAPGCNDGGSHYTQMVQENTTAVGCGISVDAGGKAHLVCNYLGWQYVGQDAFPISNCSCGGQTFAPARPMIFRKARPITLF